MGGQCGNIPEAVAGPAAPDTCPRRERKTRPVRHGMRLACPAIEACRQRSAQAAPFSACSERGGTLDTSVTSTRPPGSVASTTSHSRGSGWLMKRAGLPRALVGTHEPIPQHVAWLEPGKQDLRPQRVDTGAQRSTSVCSTNSWLALPVTFDIGQFRRITAPIIPQAARWLLKPASQTAILVPLLSLPLTTRVSKYPGAPNQIPPHLENQPRIGEERSLRRARGRSAGLRLRGHPD